MSKPQPYMLGREETGHYRSAFNKTLDIFKQLDPIHMAARSGAAYNPKTSLFTVKSFARDILVHYPSGQTTFTNSELPLMGWRLVILNYLVRADGTPLSDRLISYRELENGNVYFPAFQRESILSLSRWLEGKSPDLLGQALTNLGGVLCTGADLAAVIPALPRFPITLKIWFSDEELPGAANILFDATANHYLHTEDIAVIGGYASVFLIKEYQILTGRPWRPITL